MASPGFVIVRYMDIFRESVYTGGLKARSGCTGHFEAADTAKCQDFVGLIVGEFNSFLTVTGKSRSC